MRKFINNKNAITLSYKKQDLYKIYNQIVSRKALTAFQTEFYKKQAWKNYYQISFKGQSSLVMESRIDVILVRMNLVSSIRESRQKLASGLILVNNKIIKAYNYELIAGDIVKVNGKIGEIIKISSYILTIPKNMEVNYKLRTGIYVRKPQLNEISFP